MALFLALSLARLAKLAAGMVVFGSALFALYAPAGARRPSPPLGATALLALSLAAWLACTAVGVGGDEGDGGWPGADLLRTLVLDTGFGRAWAVQAALTVLLLAVVAVAGRGARAAWPPILAAAAGVLVAEAWIGHAAAGGPGTGAGWAWIAVMAVHLLAAGAWLGGLVPLGRALLEARRRGDGASRSVAFATLRRFSRMGYVAVALILLSGAANTVGVVGAGGALTMSYGLVLTVKLLLAAFLASIALANRMVLVPRLAEEGEASPDALEALGRTVAMEQALGLLVLAAVSVLGILPPTVGAS